MFVVMVGLGSQFDYVHRKMPVYPIDALHLKITMMLRRTSPLLSRTFSRSQMAVDVDCEDVGGG